MEGSQAEYRNLFLQYAPTPDFDVRTKVTLDSPSDGEKAFLCIWQDHDNFLRLSTTCNARPQFEVGRQIAGVYAASGTDNTIGSSVHLRIHKKGTVYAFLASPDGRRWTEVARPASASFHMVRAGIGALAARGDANRSARFRSFEWRSDQPQRRDAMAPS